MLAGAGVGGGSLVYANTLYEPLDAVLPRPAVGAHHRLARELAPYYDQAKRMLGVVDNPRETPADEVMKQVADEMGVGDTFHPTPVGVFFGGPDAQAGEQVADPFFGGAGPDRNGCLDCGECMTGCRHSAKNTLVKNYLYLAEQAGAVVHPLTTVTASGPADGGGYEVATRWTKAKLSRLTGKRRSQDVHRRPGGLLRRGARHPDAAAPARARATCRGSRPPRQLTRTNSEAILGALAPDRSIDYTEGVAITRRSTPTSTPTSSRCRYGKGSNAMGLLRPCSPTAPGAVAGADWLRELWAQRRTALDLYDFRRWSERTVIALVMQTLDNSITTRA